MLRWLAELVALTGVCLVSGWLATYTGQPPSLEVAVWPPTGVGLVAVLVRGYRLLPGVWLPHFLLGVAYSHEYAPGVCQSEAIVGAALIAAAYVVQAGLGACFIRALVGYPTKLSRLREIAWFLLAVGPLSAVLATTIVIAVLCAFGARTWDDYGLIWASGVWADLTGGVVFGILTLAVVGQPREAWEQRLYTVVAPLAVVAVLMVVGYQVARRTDDAPCEQVLAKRGSELAAAMNSEVAQVVEGLRGLEESLSDDIGRASLGSQLRLIKRTSKGVHSAGVAVLVSGEDRERFVETEQDQDPGFWLYECGDDFRPVAAGGRAVHSPVVAFEPRGGRIDRGFDLASVFGQVAVFRRAMDTGRPAVSRPTSLVDSRVGALGVIVVVPLRPRDGRGAPTAFAFASIDLRAWLHYDRELHLDGVVCQLAHRMSIPHDPPGGGMVARWPIIMADDHYVLSVSAGPEFLNERRSHYVLLTGAVGATTTILLAALLLCVTGRTALIAEQVAGRTAELEEEVAVRTFTEAVLRTMSDRLAVAQQIANLGYWEWNPDLDDAYVSPQLMELLGIAGAESNTKGRLLLTHVYPDDLPAFKSALTTALNLPQSISIEVRVVRADGEVRWVAMTISGVDTETNRHVHGTVLDITLQKRARFALEDAEARQRLALAAGGMGTLVWDVGTCRMSWDARLQSLLGLPSGSKEDGARAFFAAVHPEDRESVEETFALVDETAVPSNRGDCECEFRVVLPDGETRWMHSRGRVIRDEDDEGPPQLFSLIFDVTARKQAEAVLRASEARLAEAQRIAKLGSWEWHLPTNRVWWSAELFHMLDRAPQADPIHFDTVLEWMHPGDRGRIQAQAAAAVETGGPVPEFEARFLRPDGGVRWFRAIARLVCDESGPAWLKGVTQDITERKLAEEQRRKFEDNLQQTQRLESLGILAGGIAHDFNNLLTGMLGNASLARELLPSDSELHEFLRPIEKSAEHAAQLCQQMLAYAGKGGTVRGPLDLNDLIRDSADLIKLAASRRVNLKVEYGSSLPPVVGDAGQLRQVLLNLIQNASEALGGEHGSVTIRTRAGKGPPTLSDDMTWSGERIAGEYVCLEVTDTGCGMSPATRARIFEPFFTTKFTGRGLGLSAVHGIVKQHGGAMCVWSREGQGTTFALYLPSGLDLALADLGDDRVTLTDTPPPAKKVALLAEDESPIRTLAAVALRGLGFTVAEAADGRAAVELFRANPRQFSLAVLDIVMPELDGCEVLVELREARPDLPVVVVSGYSEFDLSDVLSDPLVRFLPKPFRPNDLTSCVRQVLQPRTPCPTAS